MVKEKGHTLIGLVSRRLGETCSQQDYAIYTNVWAFLPWIKFSILENGGMASCGNFNFSAPPTLGQYQLIIICIDKKGYIILSYFSTGV